MNAPKNLFSRPVLTRHHIAMSSGPVLFLGEGSGGFETHISLVLRL